MEIMHYFSNLGTFGNLGLFQLFPTETWELFEFSMTPPVGNFSQVLALFNFEGSLKSKFLIMGKPKYRKDTLKEIKDI